MKIGIIGAGASGLACATILEKNKIDYTIFEQNKNPGSKILASGNGRCNILNTNNIYDIDNSYLLNFLKENECPIYSDDEGRSYPVSNSSKTILDLFLNNIDKNKLILDYKVSNIKIINNKFIIDNKEFDILVLASGSKANIISKKSENCYNYLSDLNIKLTKLKPSLVGFSVKEDISLLSGLRLKAKASLYNDNKKIYSEFGEVQFKKDGISGIVIMNLSYYYNKLDRLNNPYIKLYINPDIDFNLYKDYKYILPNNCYNYFKLNNIKPNNFILNIKDTYDYTFAQVVSGGVSLTDIDSNYRYINNKNIYIAGELLDKDFPCGGYNLSYAFSTGFKIGCNINEICNRT